VVKICRLAGFGSSHIPSYTYAYIDTYLSHVSELPFFPCQL
jgi:hypothetical protein